MEKAAIQLSERVSHCMIEAAHPQNEDQIVYQNLDKKIAAIFKRFDRIPP